VLSNIRNTMALIEDGTTVAQTLEVLMFGSETHPLCLKQAVAWKSDRPPLGSQLLLGEDRERL